MLTSQAAAPAEETLQFGTFRDVHIYCSSAQPRHVVLFVSGDRGWTSASSTWRWHYEAGHDLQRLLYHWAAR